MAAGSFFRSSWVEGQFAGQGPTVDKMGSNACSPWDAVSLDWALAGTGSRWAKISLGWGLAGLKRSVFFFFSQDEQNVKIDKGAKDIHGKKSNSVKNVSGGDATFASQNAIYDIGTEIRNLPLFSHNST